MEAELAVLESGLVALELLVAEKSVAGYVRDFRAALSQLAADVFNGDKSSGQFASGLRALLRSEARPTYQEGMREGGSKDPEADMEESDEQIVDGWLADQLDYVDDFAAAVLRAKNAPIPSGSPAGVSQDEVNRSAQQVIFDRVKLWANALDALGAKGRASVQTNLAVTWYYGDTDHCPTCASLNGQRHRLKWFLQRGYIPQEPGSATLDCHGYYCQCRLISDSNEQIMP